MTLPTVNNTQNNNGSDKQSTSSQSQGDGK